MMTRIERPPATIAFFLSRRRTMRRYRSPRKVSVFPADTAASPRTRASGVTDCKQQVGRHPFRWRWSVPIQFPGFEPMSSVSLIGRSSHEATGAARSTGPDTR